MNIPLMNTLLNELETNYNTKLEITICLKLTIEWEEKHLWKLIAQNNSRNVPEIEKQFSQQGRTTVLCK